MPVLYEIFQLQVPSSMDHAHRPMAMHDCKQCQLPNEFSALGQLGYLRKSESHDHDHDAIVIDGELVFEVKNLSSLRLFFMNHIIYSLLSNLTVSPGILLV